MKKILTILFVLLVSVGWCAGTTKTTGGGTVEIATPTLSIDAANKGWVDANRPLNASFTYSGLSNLPDSIANAGSVVSRASVVASSSPASYDFASLGYGTYIIYATIEQGGESANELYEAIWLYHYQPGNAQQTCRVLLASNAPGNTYGNIYLSGTTIACTWGGNRYGRIITIKIESGWHE